ncbi:sickle tail protein-like [Pempheris klunzingeri]|uniref:sickle tail protein-like n=1 Tax=Pempheris klunzingeri TaxID=3127111 RepID=UPI00397ED828
MGHQDCMRKQVRFKATGNTHPPESSPCIGVLGLMEPQDPLTSEAMSDGEVVPPTVPFTRGSKARASLPVGSSSGQTRERTGVLYLQYGEETKQVRMPAEISSQDTLRALFVTAFPHQFTMKMLQSPSMAIYIKDTSRNVYYDLEDIRNITSHSCLKVYHKDPAHVFNHHARPANREGRVSSITKDSSHSPVHNLSSSSRSTLCSLQGSMSPPTVRSMPSSPSRMAYTGGCTGGGAGLVDLVSAMLPQERLSGAGRSNTLCYNSSAILERRDIKPDENAGSSKSMALVVRSEGGPHYPDTYCSSLQDGAGGRLSITSSQCSAPLMGYGNSMEHQTGSLHRHKIRKYGDSQHLPLGTKTPPLSPHRVNEVQMIDRQSIGGLSPERMSPIHQWRDSNGATVEIVNRSRRSYSLSSTSSVFVDGHLEQHNRQGYVTASNTQSDRMKAMEEQIASLAGLVHHALSMGPNLPGVKDPVRETAGRKLLNNRPGEISIFFNYMSPEPQNPDVRIENFSPGPLALQLRPSDSGLQQSLVLAKTNVCELRLQLNQLRHLQLSTQESVSSMLRIAGQELLVLMCDQLSLSEMTAHRQRAEIEEEQIHYLATKERILTQLSELENYVDFLRRRSASSPDYLSVTLRDVEEGAVNLKKVGEALTILQGEFPELQMKMRSVLRLEVEAVCFLREEPHNIDSMLKRVKALTEALSCLRRYSLTSLIKSNPQTNKGPLKTQSPQSPQNSPKPQPRSSVMPPLPTPSLSGSQAEVRQVSSASPIMACRMKSTATTAIQPSHHHPSPPLTPTHGQDSPTVSKVSPHSRESSPALQRRLGPLQSDDINQPVPTPRQESNTDQTVIKHIQMHTETSGSSVSCPGQRSHTKSRYSSSTGSPEKTSKGQQQATQEDPSQSSLLLSTIVSHGARSVQTSASDPSSPGRGKKRVGGQAGQVLSAAAGVPKDAV